jgi:AcrR family transcriptional regulator
MGDWSPIFEGIAFMPRHRESERDQVRSETRQMLLEAAAGEFASEGYAGANVDRISREAGFAKGTIYNYFDSKRALMLAVIDEVATTHLAFIGGRVREETDPRIRLERFFEAGFAFVTEHLAQARVMVTTLSGPDAEFKEHMYAAYQPMFQLVGGDILVPGITQGYFRQVDPASTAVLLMTLYLGTGSQVSEDGHLWLDPGQVAAFALHALEMREPSGPEEV